MDKLIIKGAGTINEILTALKTLSAVFGKDATLEEVATAMTNRQLEEKRGQTK